MPITLYAHTLPLALSCTPISSSQWSLSWTLRLVSIATNDAGKANDCGSSGDDGAKNNSSENQENYG